MSEWKSPQLIRMAAEAQAMTPELWEAMKRGYRHAPLRPGHTNPTRARINHDNLGVLYTRARNQNARVLG
jgi:hypothetical protein